MSKGKRISRKNQMVSRRDFLRFSAGITAGVAAGSVAGAFSPGPAVAQSPTGTINVVTSADADSYDPHSWISDDGRMIGAHVFESLISRDYKPMLAPSWENPDKFTWVFHLKRGVEFTNGVFGNSLLRGGNLHRFQHLNRLFQSISSRHPLMELEDLRHLIPDGEHRIQRIHWVLKNHGDPVPPEFLHLIL